MNWKIITANVILFIAMIAAWHTGADVELNTAHRWITSIILMLFFLGFAVMCMGIAEEKDKEIREIKERKRFCLLLLPDFVVLKNTLWILTERIFETEREIQTSQGKTAEDQIQSLENLRYAQVERFEELAELMNKLTPYRVSPKLNDYRYRETRIS